VTAYVDRPEVFGADEQTDVELDLLRWVGFARLVLQEERVAPEAEMSLIFVDRPTITDLNERFLGGRGPTDVLAFPIDDDVVASGREPDLGGRGPGAPGDPTDPPIVVGDVIVCPEVAQRQSSQRSTDVADELALLVVHGVLHLLNYDHATERDAAAMQAREQELIARFHDREQGSTR